MKYCTQWTYIYLTIHNSLHDYISDDNDDTVSDQCTRPVTRDTNTATQQEQTSARDQHSIQIPRTRSHRDIPGWCGLYIIR